MIPLTAKQSELLNYLKSCERSPSFEEMQTALNLKSKSGVHRLVNGLAERGYIRRLPNRARAIEVCEGELPDTLERFSVTQIAQEAKRRGLVLGNIYRDHEGRRRFEALSA